MFTHFSLTILHLHLSSEIADTFVLHLFGDHHSYYHQHHLTIANEIIIKQRCII